MAAKPRKRRRPPGTGQVYRPSYRTPAGPRQVAEWWIRYTAAGKRHAESTGRTSKAEAEQVLRERLSARDAGLPLGRDADALTLASLADAIRADYKANSRKSGPRLEQSLTHLQRLIPAATPARRIDEETVTAYTARRLGEQAKPATVNRELAALRRMLRLGRRRLPRVPEVKLLHEDNARRGFLDRSHLDAILPHLPAEAQGVVVAAYVTGWRVRSEILTRQWRHVDLVGGWLRLDPGETKNGLGREWPLIPDLREVMERQRAYTDELEIASGSIIPWVFHRAGKQVRSIREAWDVARRAAGRPGALLHDFRRSAARNLLRAGVPQRIAMALCGWETDSIFRRYAIADSEMLQEAGAKLASFLGKGRKA